MKRTWKDYFIFSKKERVAIILLLASMACFLLIPYVYSIKELPPKVNPVLSAFIESRQGDSAIKALREDEFANNRSDSFAYGNDKYLFRFDPNTINFAGWVRLGLRPKTAKTILNYLSKGGRFKKPEGIRKIWGISQKQADYLIPYIDLVSQKSDLQYRSQSVTERQVIKSKISHFDINLATLEDWQSLPGIGVFLANRIIQYRDRIGGFTKIDQLKKVYGISDTLLLQLAPFLQINLLTMQKLDLNKVGLTELSDRTGISQAVARGILIYRQQTGPFQSVEDLKKIVFITDSVFEMVRPHVVVR